MFLLFRILILLFLGCLLNSCRTHLTKSRELLFWCSNNDREIKLSISITDKWNQAHPGDLIHLQPVPEGQSSEEVILAAVVGKTTPDIYANMRQESVEMYYKAGVLIQLDTLKGFRQFLNTRCDSVMLSEITSSDGHIYQIPWKVNPIMTIYNKSLFEANNIQSVPKTYSTYMQAAEIFKRNNKGNNLQKRFGYTETKVLWYQRLFNFYPLYLAASNGAPLISNNRAAFNNKYAIGVFRFLQNLYNNDYFSKESAGASSDPFVAENIATKWTGPWEIPYLYSIPDRHFVFDYYEQIVPDDHIGPIYTYADPKNIVIFNTCTDPQKAWDFLQTLISKEGDLQLLEVSGQLPRRKELETDSYYKSYFERNPMMKRFAKQLPYVKGIDNCEQIVEVLDIISQEYEACVVYGRKTPEKAIAEAAAAVDVLLAGSK